MSPLGVFPPLLLRALAVVALAQADEAEKQFLAELMFEGTPTAPITVAPAELLRPGGADAQALRDDELVIGVASGEEARAYPLRTVSVAEVLNDTLGDAAIAVTWCVVCQASVVYSRKVDDRLLTFGNQRSLYRSSAVVYDAETKSLWVQGMGRAMSGALRGRLLSPLPSSLTTWEQWKAEHPETTVYARQLRGTKQRNRVYAWDPEMLERMGFVVRVGGAARLYPLEELDRKGFVQDELGGVPIVVVYSLERRLLQAFRREADGKPVVVELKASSLEAEGAPPPQLLLMEVGGTRRWHAGTGRSEPEDAGAPALERLITHPLRASLFTEYFPEGTLYAPPAPARREALTLEQALAAGRDVWGEASLREPDGPSFEFFARLLPPLRYVNTRFRHYPIVLGRPDALVKARFVSNGSGVNLLAGTETWRDAALVPVEFLVRGQGGGASAGVEPFGEDLDRLDGPRLADGWLPIVELSYQSGGATIRQEAFAGVDAPGDDAIVYVRFSVVGPTSCEIVLRLGADVPAAARESSLIVLPGEPRQIEIATRDVARASGPARAILPEAYDRARARCVEQWTGVVGRSARIVTGEKRVDDAWRALVVGTLLLAQGDTLNYSAGNSYETTFEAECADAVRALMFFGVPDARRFVAPLLVRPLQGGIELSDVSYKLQLLAWQHELERDAALTRDHWKRVGAEVDRALEWIEPESGLVPAQAYCGDIATKVHNLLANAAFWRGLRDGAIVLRKLGESRDASRYDAAATRLREHVLAAVDKSERSDVSPTFVPIALFGAEQPYELLTQTKEGAYWNLIAPYVYDSGIFGPGSPRTKAMVDWQLERGGLCMGMVRFDQHSGLFANEKGVDDLYTLRLVEELLRRDEPDRALVSFYGKLAQGMSRDTFVGGEGSSLVPLDRHGRPMYLPPNCAANAFFLWTLRHLLVQDFDLDCDGRAETLRLLFATPRRWLADGAHVEVKRAPTMFGELSLDVVSDLAHGRVRIELDLPARPTRRTLLRLRMPEGRRIARAAAGGAALELVDAETIDLTGRRGAWALDVIVGAATERR